MKKQFAVIGLGNFGSQLAIELCRRGAEVLAIDESLEAVEDVKDHVTHAVRLDATEEAALAEQQMDRFDAVIVSFGVEFETSLLTVMLLKQLKVKRIIVRATTVRHEKILNLLDIEEVILPVTEAVQRLSTSLLTSRLVESLSFSGDYALAEVPAPEAVIGKNVTEAGFGTTFNLLLVTIMRTRRHVRFFGVGTKISQDLMGIPEPGTIIERGDILIVFGKRGDLEEFAKT